MCSPLSCTFSWFLGLQNTFPFYLIRSGHFLETVRTCGGKKIIYDFLCPGQSSRAPAQCQGNVDEPTSADSFLPFFFPIDLQMGSCALRPPAGPFILALKMTIWAPHHRRFKRGWGFFFNPSCFCCPETFLIYMYCSKLNIIHLFF